MLKKEFDKYGSLLKLDDCSIVQSLVNECIRKCYDLNEVTVKVLNVYYAKVQGLYDEPINWGDLKCTLVEKIDKYIAYIEEASPECYNLQAYISEWLKKWGWNVEVKTSW